MFTMIEELFDYGMDQFNCSNGKCVNAKLACDGKNDVWSEWTRLDCRRQYVLSQSNGIVFHGGHLLDSALDFIRIATINGGAQPLAWAHSKKAVEIVFHKFSFNAFAHVNEFQKKESSCYKASDESFVIVVTDKTKVTGYPIDESQLRRIAINAEVYPSKDLKELPLICNAKFLHMCPTCGDVTLMGWRADNKIMSAGIDRELVVNWNFEKERPLHNKPSSKWSEKISTVNDVSDIVFTVCADFGFQTYTYRKN
ncbi:unnamed protein product [Caenorhabditis nigoni]